MKRLFGVLLGLLLASPAAASPLYGLFAMGSQAWLTTDAVPPNALEEPYAHPSVYTGAVCDLRWKDLQLTNGGALVTTQIDACLTTWAAYNATYPAAPLVMKLRVFGGRQAPDWAKALVGGPLTVNGGGPYTVGYWWTATYKTAWSDFISALATAYRSNALIKEVAIASCAGSNGGEPFILQAGPADIAALAAAGYTDAQGQSCLSNGWAAYSGWTNQTLDYTFSMFEGVDTGTMVYNPTYTIGVMEAFRAAFPTGVVGTHGLQNPATGAANYPIYPEFIIQKYPVEFQTVDQTQCSLATFNIGISFYMAEFEIWNTTAAGGSCGYSLSDLQTMAGTLNLKQTVGSISLRR